MYNMDWNIVFTTASKKYKLRLISEVSINKSVETLTDTARIVLPASVMNKALALEDSIKCGDTVIIKLGYNGKLRNEFEGFISAIHTNDGVLTIECEDGLFMFKKPLSDVELKNTSMKKIAARLVSEIKAGLKVNCTMDIGYSKFTIHQATAYDVLKKLQEETKANIYLANGELHIHHPYQGKGGKVKYDFSKNIESSNLEYKKAAERKVEVIVETEGKDGKMIKATAGTTGGEKITRKVSAVEAADIKKIAEAEVARRSFDGYEGSVTGWLWPVVEPAYTVALVDKSYPNKDGKYFVPGVTTTFSASGAKREVSLGLKVG